MPWACRLIDFLEDAGGDEDNLQPGDMFFYDASKDQFVDAVNGAQPHDVWYFVRHTAKAAHLSDFYFENNAHRLPLVVMLPNRVLFCVDSKCINNGIRSGGWSVSGTAPNITVSPSINVGGAYHGFLRNGIIEDDV